MTKTVTVLVLLVGLARNAPAQSPSRFTVDHVVHFAPGNDRIRQQLSTDPSLRELTAAPFMSALEDLNDDGVKELIVMAGSSPSCGGGGCTIAVLEIRAGKIATVLSRSVVGTLAVTAEKAGPYRALATVDNTGAIVESDKAGKSLPGKQLVYAIEIAQAAQPRQTPPPPPAPPGQGVCGNQLFCTETLTFAAAITDVQAILQNTNSKTLTLRMSFRNKANRPIILGYVSGSGIATDDRGNRYVPAGQRAVQGIGVVQGTTGDPKFTLQPGESSDARFEFVWNSSGQEIFGLSFQVELAVREIEPLPGNQIRLGREHALHFSGLGSRSGTGSPRPTAPPVPPPISTGAPTSAGAAAPQADACAGRPRCYSAGPFVAEVIGLIPSSIPYATPVDVFQARVRFRNLASHPVTLAYAAGSAVLTDNFGNRYASNNPSVGDGAKGMGIVRGDQADPQFVLNAGASGDATFTVSRGRGRTDRIGETASLDITIVQLEVLPSQQVRTVREFSVGFMNLPASGGNTTRSEPVANAGMVAQSDACGLKPKCYSGGPFVAEIIGLTSSSLPYATPVDVLQARVRFRNVTNQPITLGYAAGSAQVTDNFGNRYASTSPAAGDGAKGIGIVRGDQADPQFVLGPAASGDVTFSVSRSRGRTDRVGATFTLDMTIAQLEVLDSRQVRTVREYAVGVPNLTTSGQGILNRLLQGLPKKD